MKTGYLSRFIGICNGRPPFQWGFLGSALKQKVSSLSFDPEDVPLDYFWFVNGNLVGMDAVVTALLPVGDYTVDIIVGDGFRTDADTIVVRVITACQASNNLSAQVNAANIPAGVKSDLNARLNAAAASFDRRQPERGGRFFLTR
jgi:hypothetical protein